MATEHIHKAARLIVLLELDQAGLLTGLTLQELADALGAGNHRSTILRDLRLLPALRREAGRIRRRLERAGMG